MTIYRTKHADPLQRIVATYGQGPGLISALESYCQTVEDNARQAGKASAGEVACIGLHNGPSQGLVCKTCVEAERDAPMLAVVEAEIEMAQERKG